MDRLVKLGDDELGGDGISHVSVISLPRQGDPYGVVCLNHQTPK